MLAVDLKELRERAEIPQLKLAMMSGVSQNVVGYIERQERDVGYTKVEKMFKALGYELIPVPIEKEEEEYNPKWICEGCEYPIPEPGPNGYYCNTCGWRTFKPEHKKEY